MVTKDQINKWFARGKNPTEDQYKQTHASFFHKSEKLPITQIFGLQEEIAKATTNFKGYHTSLTDLQTAYPQAENKKDFFAWVGSPYPGTVYVVKENVGAWTDTGEVPTQQEIDLAEYIKKDDLAQNVGDNTTKAISQAGVKSSILSIEGIEYDKDGSTGGLNIFDNSALVTGQYIGANGTIQTGSEIAYNQNYVSVEANTTYATDLIDLGYTLFFYDSSKNYLSHIGGDTQKPLGSFTTPANCAYIRYNFWLKTGTSGFYIKKQGSGSVDVNGIYFDKLYVREENILKSSSIGAYSINMRNTNTYVGGMNTIIDALLAKKPRARFAFISHFIDESVYTTRNLVDTQIALANYWNAEILDLSQKMNLIQKDGVNNLTPIVPDNLHPGTDSTGQTVDKIKTFCVDFLRPMFDDWTGKRIAWYGTSIPYGHPNPKLYAYPNLVANKLGAICDNYAIGASVIRLNTTTGSGIEGRHSLLDTKQNVNYISKMIDLIGTPSEPDILVFDYGVNDFYLDRTDFNVG